MRIHRRCNPEPCNAWITTVEDPDWRHTIDIIVEKDTVEEATRESLVQARQEGMKQPRILKQLGPFTQTECIRVMRRSMDEAKAKVKEMLRGVDPRFNPSAEHTNSISYDTAIRLLDTIAWNDWAYEILDNETPGDFYEKNSILRAIDEARAKLVEPLPDRDIRYVSCRQCGKDIPFDTDATLGEQFCKECLERGW